MNANLAGQECPDEVCLLAEKTEPRVAVRSDRDIPLSDVALGDLDGSVANRDGRFELLSGKSEVIDRAQPL